MDFRLQTIDHAGNWSGWHFGSFFRRTYFNTLEEAQAAKQAAVKAGYSVKQLRIVQSNGQTGEAYKETVIEAPEVK